MHRIAVGLALVMLFCATQASAAPVIIEGVPQTGWRAGHQTQTIDCLHAGLVAMGCPVSYDDFMVASGAAFRIAWWPGLYSYGAPEEAPEDLIVTGAEAVGGGAERVEYTTLDEAWKTVCRSIDEGCPVLVQRGQGYRVICGYDLDGQQMHYRDYNVSTPEYAVGPFEAPTPPWPRKGGHEIILLLYDKEQTPPELDWPTILERAVRFADWPENDKLLGLFVAGFGAYDAWAQTLRGGPDRNGAETDAQAVEFMALNMAEARACASVVLQEHAEVHEAFADAASAYMEEATLFKQLLTLLHGTPNPPGEGAVLATMAANIGNRQACEQLAQLIEQAQEKDMLAVEALREALNDLSHQAEAVKPPQTPPAPPAAEDKTALAKEHCENGKQLKAARQFQEAATELRQAIGIDPKLVEAHRILGWVLIELKDTDGAKGAFRKVIELAPGTDQAQEAQQALARLGQ